MKVCSKCGVAKDETAFCRRKDSGKLRNECRECKNEYLSKYRKEREMVDPRFKRNSDLKRNYGLTLKAWSTLLESQGGVCAICKQPETRMNNQLSVDHDHKTGKIRGLLCNNCNRSLGLLKDSVATLSAAIEYLKRTGSDSGLE